MGSLRFSDFNTTLIRRLQAAAGGPILHDERQVKGDPQEICIFVSRIAAGEQHIGAKKYQQAAKVERQYGLNGNMLDFAKN